MTEEQTLYIAQTVLASAFYYGLAGGLVGACLVALLPRAFRRVVSFFRWR